MIAVSQTWKVGNISNYIWLIGKHQFKYTGGGILSETSWFNNMLTKKQVMYFIQKEFNVHNYCLGTPSYWTS